MYGYYTLELEIDTVFTCFDKLHTSGTPLALKNGWKIHSFFVRCSFSS